MVSEQSTVLIEKRGDLHIITLNRPDVRNAVDFPTAKALSDAFIAFDQDDSAKVAVFAGANGTFCSGADLKSIEDDVQDRIQVHDTASEQQPDAPLGLSYLQLSKPVIGAISGYAVAGGLELALWCDMRVVEEDAVFGVFCRRWGVPLVDGGTVRLPRLIGHSNAMDLILTGRPVDAHEAKTMGLANRVVPTGTSLEEAIRLAEQISKFPQTCMRNDRASAYQQWDLDFEEALNLEARLGRATLESGETLAGAKRFADGKGRSGSFDDI